MATNEELRKAVSEFLSRKFWEWQAGDRKKTIRQWSAWIHPEVTEGALLHWMNGGRVPTESTAYRLATKYPEILHILGIEEGELEILIAAWPLLDSVERQQIADQAEQYLAEKGTGDVKGAVKSST